MAFNLNSSDVLGFKILFSIGLMYGVISVVVYSIVHMKFITPLGIDAPIDRFSEGRAVEHVRVLSEEIEGRQEGRHGLREAATYIRKELYLLKDRAQPNIRVEIDDNVVGGSFNMMFLGHGISLAYRNHTNIVMRISSVDAFESDASVLVNGHYDGPIGSPGAADCGSCVASMMEVARLIVDSGYVPPRPIIFLFNGAEELFLLGSHGFVKTHKWYDSIGAFINIEASGSGGPDLVCQSGPGGWPSLIYAQSAIYPMAHSAAQDVFPVIPGDTDYRIFAEDGSDIPGLDIIFLLGGYFYHTSFDTLERLLPGSVQARGDNLFSLLKTFTSSSNLQTSQERATARASVEDSEERAVFFDYLSLFMIIYSKKVAVVLHCVPVLIFVVMPFVLRVPKVGFHIALATLVDFVKGTLIHATGIVLGVVVPVLMSILRLLFSSHAMNWFQYPCLAYMMFIPSSLIGILIPRLIWKSIPLSQDVTALKTSYKELEAEARFWGSFGYYALFTMAYILAGLSGGFLTFTTAASMLVAWVCFRISVRVSGLKSARLAMYYVLPLVPCMVYSAYFGGFLVQFLIEKMGMMGSLPLPYGFFIPDIIIAAVIGIVTGMCMGPLVPVCGHWLARASILKFLLHLTVGFLALSSQFFPYSSEAPKRVVFQHTVVTLGVREIMDSSYDFSVVDSNSLSFVFKHSPEVAKELGIVSDLSLGTVVKLSEPNNWLALFPVSFLFSKSLKFPCGSEEIMNQYQHFPSMSAYRPETLHNDGFRRVHLDLDLGSVKEAWVTVLNITGPLSSWSFAEHKVPAPETMNNGPPSYILRLSGSSSEKWRFWLEANGSKALRVEVAVLDQHLVDGAKKLKTLFPGWVDVTGYSSFLSSYTF